jgi:hypothetical protein
MLGSNENQKSGESQRAMGDLKLHTPLQSTKIPDIVTLTDKV